MKWFNKIRKVRNTAYEDFIKGNDLGTSSLSGLYVSEENSIMVSGVFACVRVIAEDMASLPLPLYKRLPRGKEKATDHPLYYLIHDSPNEDKNRIRNYIKIGGMIRMNKKLFAIMEKRKEKNLKIKHRQCLIQQAKKANEHELEKKAYYVFACASCGKKFESYGNKSRKYCSHACYIDARFNEGGEHNVKRAI